MPLARNFTKLAFAIMLAAGSSAPAFGQSQSYVSVSGGLGIAADSENAGELTSAFTTGAGTTIPAGTSLPAGTALAWDTDFDPGYNFGFAYGMSTGTGFRSEFEARYLRNNIDMHENVTVGGGAIGTEDAGILIPGSGNLGVSVADVVADGQGRTDTWSFMGNVFFDFNPSGIVNPYVGGGIGYATTKVMFNPSGVDIASDRDGGFAYQGIVGVDTGSSNVRVFGEYRYFATSDVETDLNLLPGVLDVENSSNQFSGGIRFHF